MTDAADDSTSEPQLGVWGEPAPQPAWTAIDVEADSAGPGSAEPGPSPQAPGGRLRRPSSLRAQSGESVNVPRRKLSPPPFQPQPTPAAAPSEPSGPSPLTGAVTERVQAGRAEVEKQAEKFVALVQERPEVGLGVAFFGGLILASILKRLAR